MTGIRELPWPRDKLVLQRQRHLKWRALDWLELRVDGGLRRALLRLLALGDRRHRHAQLGSPWLWLQEVTSTLFIYAIFIGTAVATRRNDHLYLTAISEAMHGTTRMIVEVIIRVVVLGVAFCLIWYGYINYLRGFGSFRLPSGTPIASLYAVIPISGALIALFTIEQLVNGLRNGFEHPEPPQDDGAVPTVEGSQRGRGRERSLSSSSLMTICFLFFGYLGVPVPFSLMAGVFIGAILSDVSLAAIIQKIFDGVDSEALLAIPFFLLVGELMSSANVVVRIANLSVALVGHIRGGLSQVVVVFSMFFSEMSGSTTADVAVMTRALGGPMKREGYSPPSSPRSSRRPRPSPRWCRPASPRSSMARSATSRSRACSWRASCPGMMIGFGLMIYCYFFGPSGLRKPRAPLRQVVLRGR